MDIALIQTKNAVTRAVTNDWTNVSAESMFISITRVIGCICLSWK